jgi:hypothetical protein
MLDESPLCSSINKDINYMLMTNKKLNFKKIVLINTFFKFWKISGNRNFLYKKNKIDESTIKKILLSSI